MSPTSKCYGTSQRVCCLLPKRRRIVQPSCSDILIGTIELCFLMSTSVLLRLNTSIIIINTGWFKMMESLRKSLRLYGASTHARQLVAVFQVLCSLYGLTCVGDAQNSLEFVSRSPLIHVVGRSFCLYTDSLFAQIGDSNDKCSSSLEVECWNEDETHAVQQSPTQF